MSSIGRVPGSPPDFDVHHVDTPTAPASTVAPAPARTTTPASTTTATTARTTTTATATTTLPGDLAVGTLDGSGKQVSFDPLKGTFSARSGSATATGSAALYAAAELVASGNVAFLHDPKLGSTGRLKLATTLEGALKQGNGSTGVAKQADLQARSGAATIALAQAKDLPEGDPVKGRLVAAYVAQLGAEPQRGLKASMVLNLDDAVKAGKVKLTAAQAADFAKAKEATFPSKPPYDTWFKGQDKLSMRHYIHEEFFDEDSKDYEALGFKKTVLGPGHYAFDKSYDGDAGKKMPVHVETFRVSDDPKTPGTLPMKKIFGDMNDPNVQIEFYGGHSNLGGNVLGGLADGPAIQKGDKWVVDWMCRGKQVLADVYNKYPDAHYMTTTTPVYAQGPALMDSMFKGIAHREGYDKIKSRFSSDSQAGSLMFPNDPKVLEVRDLDQDGQVDVGAKGVDPLWNTGMKHLGEGKRDLKPVASTDTPQDLEGSKVMRGVNFANTFITYHHEHENDGRIPAGVEDHITAGGFFVDPKSDDLCKITERKVGGETFYDVAVNTKYAGQETNAIGAGILYELNRYLTKKQQNGAYTEQDKLRGAVFAGEYCAYMAESYEQVDQVMHAVRDRYGFPAALSWDNVNKAIGSDDHGYATQKQSDELKKMIGSVDPTKG